jgi:hypothetical protein
MDNDTFAWFGPIPSKSQVLGSVMGRKNVTFWSAHKQTCGVDIDGEWRGGCVNEVAKIGRDSTINKGGQ